MAARKDTRAPPPRHRRPPRRPRRRHHRLLRLRRRRQDDDRGRPRASARPRPAARSSSSPSTRPAASPRPSASPSSTTPPARWPGSTSPRGGSLDAMMLDMKRTFDEVVETHATPEKAAADPRQPLLPGRVELVRGHAGVHGHGEARPAARAGRRRRHVGPHRRRHPAVAVGAGLPRRPQAARLLPRRPLRAPAHGPAKAGGRAYLKVFSVGVDLAQRTISRVLGGQLLMDVQTFVAALDTMFGGFRERADVTYALLKEDTTAFVVVASPDRDALREAAFFVDRLGEERMPLAGVVVNRLQSLGAAALSASRAEDGADQLARGRAGGDAHGRAAGAARRPGVDGGAPARRASRGSRASHPDVLLATVPPRRPTCTTSTGCARWVGCSPADRHPARTPRSTREPGRSPRRRPTRHTRSDVRPAGGPSSC